MTMALPVETWEFADVIFSDVINNCRMWRNVMDCVATGTSLLGANYYEVSVFRYCCCCCCFLCRIHSFFPPFLLCKPELAFFKTCLSDMLKKNKPKTPPFFFSFSFFLFFFPSFSVGFRVRFGDSLVALLLPKNVTLKGSQSLPTLMQVSFWWWQCPVRYSLSLSPSPEILVFASTSSETTGR